MTVKERALCVLWAYRDAGHLITDAEFNDVLRITNRKIENSGNLSDDEYAMLVFADEMKNFVFRRFVNMLAEETAERREVDYVQYLLTDAVQPTVPERVGA